MRPNFSVRKSLRYALTLTGLVAPLLAPAIGARADNGDYAYYQYGDYGYNIVHMPDLDQRRAASATSVGLPNNGKMYCVPTACMNTLAYVANHGYNVFPGANDWQWNNNNQYNTMSVDLFNMGVLMGTNPTKGTSGAGAYNGVTAFLNPVQFTVSTPFAYQSYSPLFKDLATISIQGSLVDVGVGWYSNPDTPYIHTRNGGHFITLVEAANEPLGPGQASFGFRDPNRDTADLFTQSIFTTVYRDVTDVPGLYADGNGLAARTESRVMNYGSAYIDNALIITPKFGFTTQNDNFNMILPIVLFNAEKHKSLVRYPSQDVGKIGDIALDVLSVRSPYIIEGRDGVFEIDHLSGETTLLPAVQDNPNGAPPLSKPKQIQFGGPEHKLFVLQDMQLSRLSRAGMVEKQAPLRQPLLAIRYNDRMASLFGYAADGTLYRFSDDLKIMSASQLPKFAKPNVDGVMPRLRMADSPITGDLWFLCDGSVTVYDVPFRDGRPAAAHSVRLAGAVSPQGLDVDEAGSLFVSDGGKIKVFDGTGKLRKDPFTGMPGGDSVHIVRGFNNFMPATETGPAYYNVVLEDTKRP